MSAGRSGRRCLDRFRRRGEEVTSVGDDRKDATLGAGVRVCGGDADPEHHGGCHSGLRTPRAGPAQRRCSIIVISFPIRRPGSDPILFARRFGDWAEGLWLGSHPRRRDGVPHRTVAKAPNLRRRMRRALVPERERVGTEPIRAVLTRALPTNACTPPP